MEDNFDPVYEDFRLTLTMVGTATEPARYAVKNAAMGDRLLGYLMLTQDEATKVRDLISSPRNSRSDNLSLYLRKYMSSPDAYTHNGRTLSSYSSPEQVDILSRLFEQGKNPSYLPH